MMILQAVSYCVYPPTCVYTVPPHGEGWALHNNNIIFGHVITIII
jgi:hypothetical protein